MFGCDDFFKLHNAPQTACNSKHVLWFHTTAFLLRKTELWLYTELRLLCYYIEFCFIWYGLMRIITVKFCEI